MSVNTQQDSTTNHQNNSNNKPFFSVFIKEDTCQLKTQFKTKYLKYAIALIVTKMIGLVYFLYPKLAP